jgi:hypothetical protein
VRKQKQEDGEYEANLTYIAESILKVFLLYTKEINYWILPWDIEPYVCQCDTIVL